LVVAALPVAEVASREEDSEAGLAVERLEQAASPAEVSGAVIEEGSEIPPIPTGSQEEWEITRARELFLL
jgi:hypothetical protein